MTYPAPSEATEVHITTRLGKIGELGNATTTFSEKVDEAIRVRLQWLLDLSPEQRKTLDPQRVEDIRAELFEAVDRLIYLGDEVAGFGRLLAEERGVRTEKPKRIRSRERHTPEDETALIALLAAQNGAPVSIHDLLDQGFGTDYSDDLDTRKRLLQAAIRARFALQTDTDPYLLVKTGQTRGTKYYIVAQGEVIEHEEASKQEETPVAEELPEETVVRTSLDTPLTPIATPMDLPAKRPDVAPHPTVIERQERTMEEKLGNAITALLAQDRERPLICLIDILRISFPDQRLTKGELDTLDQFVAQDSRLERINPREYHIQGRDLEGAWIDHRSLREATERFIRQVLKWDSTEGRVNSLYGAASHGRRWLTQAERAVLIGYLKDHPQFISFTDNTEETFTLRPQAPNHQNTAPHHRGMSSDELDTRLGELHIRGQKPRMRARP